MASALEPTVAPVGGYFGGAGPALSRGQSERGGIRGSFLLQRRNSSGGRESSTSSEGLFGSFRRPSLDLQANRDDLDTSGNGRSAGPRRRASVSEYQEVFQKMKAEHPQSSLGALQQKTMAKIAQLKAEREAKQRKIEEEFLRQEEEERWRSQNLAQKWVDKLRHGELGGGGRAETRRDSFYTSSTAAETDAPHHGHGHGHVRSSFIHRRHSLESEGNPPHGSSPEDEILRVRAELVAAGGCGDDQGLNFAPKKSVGDLKALRGSCASERSVRSGVSALSDASGLFVDGEESAASGMDGVWATACDDDDDDETHGNDPDGKIEPQNPQDLASLLDALDASTPGGAPRESDDESSKWEVRSDGLIVGFVDRDALLCCCCSDGDLIVDFSEGGDDDEEGRDGADEAAGLGGGGGTRGGGFRPSPSPYGPAKKRKEKQCRTWFGGRRNGFPAEMPVRTSSAVN